MRGAAYQDVMNYVPTKAFHGFPGHDVSRPYERNSEDDVFHRYKKKSKAHYIAFPGLPGCDVSCPYERNPEDDVLHTGR